MMPVGEGGGEGLLGDTLFNVRMKAARFMRTLE